MHAPENYMENLRREKLPSKEREKEKEKDSARSEVLYEVLNALF